MRREFGQARRFQDDVSEQTENVAAVGVSRWSYAVMTLLAWAMMTLQLTQTRILSWIFHNHVVYLTITVALLGFGVSGVVISLLAKRGRRLEHWTLAAIGGFAFSTPICIWLASAAPVLFGAGDEQLKLLFCYAVLVVPFVFAGAGIGLILLRGAARVHTLYFFDLAASGVAALGFTALLRPLGAEWLVWAAVGVSTLAFAIQAWLCRLRAALLVALVAPAALAFLFRDGLLLDRVESYKFLARAYDRSREHVRMEHVEWSPIARIDVFSDPEIHLFEDRRDASAGDFKVLTQDGDAISVLPGPNWRARILAEPDPTKPLTPHNYGYVVRPNPERALVIGIGGGIDVVSAVSFGAKKVVAAEINPVTVDLMQGKYASYLEWPRWPQVDLVAAEGRHLVRSSTEQFDTITMAAVDTFSALSSGAYVLSENYLYTVEAMEDYMRALKPRGVFTVFRWLFRHPRESLRLSNLYMEAASRLGVAEPDKCVMIIGVDYGWSYRWAATMFRREPFTPAEVRAVLERARGQERTAAVYIPKVFPEEEQRALEAVEFAREQAYYEPTRAAFAKLIRSPSTSARRAMEREYFYNIEPVWDDRPFFFEYHKLGEFFSAPDKNEHGIRGVIVHYVLYFLVAIAALVSAGAILGPLYVFEREGLKVKGLRHLAGLFACLGVGFMFIEIGMIQRLNLYLGHPTYSLSVVLAGLLAFTGVGSHRAGKLSLTPDKALALGTLAPALLSLVWLVVMSFVVNATLTAPLSVRIGIVLLSLLPVGLALGVPFATALRYVDAHDRRFVPWAWGINGLASVVASVLSVLLAMRIGFAWVVVLGVGVYLLGFLVVRRHFVVRPPVS
ncbi:MAG TPA: hypothetical protein VM686_11995 [Polyangiaceae bacterium]|nr:hypothetical protein [Polyangiaceae bacterium]